VDQAGWKRDFLLQCTCSAVGVRTAFKPTSCETETRLIFSMGGDEPWWEMIVFMFYVME
jgi:hypothetical protein